uniref:Putative secreted protein n=1 Tax=Anopheles darlingi TaxID=43151 RepID=A0A2M4DGD7_ANODA
MVKTIGCRAAAARGVAGGGELSLPPLLLLLLLPSLLTAIESSDGCTSSTSGDGDGDGEMFRSSGCKTEPPFERTDRDRDRDRERVRERCAVRGGWETAEDDEEVVEEDDRERYLLATPISSS